jgi:phosphate transport system substrate-binding protein
LDRKNDFGCTDACMTDQQLADALQHGSEVVHIPLLMGAVVPAYNVAGLTGVRFSGDVLADVFLGKITRWDHPRLQAINPDVKLPPLEIAVVHRADGSGTTFIFSDYLCKVSSEWEQGPGRGIDLKWPTDIGAEKNDGVAGQISRTPSAIGYVELIYAMNKKDVQFGPVKNPAGEFVLGSLEGVTAAAEATLTDVPDDLRYSITNAPGKDSYPIAGTVWVVCDVGQSPEKARALAAFLRWALHEGQDLAAELHYARLPQGLVERAEKKIDAFQATP